MTLRAVVGKTPAASLPAVFVGGYNLRDARERVQLFWHVVRQVDEQVARLDPASTDPDRYRRTARVALLVDDFMRNETSVAKRPQKIVQLPGLVAVFHLDAHRVLQAIRLLRQATGKDLPRLFSRCGNQVKINARHPVLPQLKQISGQDARALQQEFREHWHGASGSALLRGGQPRGAGDIEMRPVETVRELAQERSRRDRATFAARS